MSNIKKNLVDKDIIVQRSLEYGNNFPMFSMLLNNFFKIKYGVQLGITPSDSAMILSLLKISRLSNNPNNQDTMLDFINYCWLGLDYDEYVCMMQNQQKNKGV